MRINKQRLKSLLEFLVVLCGALVFTAVTIGIIAIGIEYPVPVISVLISLAVLVMIYYVLETDK